MSNNEKKFKNYVNGTNAPQKYSNSDTVTVGEDIQGLGHTSSAMQLSTHKHEYSVLLTILRPTDDVNKKVLSQIESLDPDMFTTPIGRGGMKLVREYTKRGMRATLEDLYKSPRFQTTDIQAHVKDMHDYIKDKKIKPIKDLLELKAHVWHIASHGNIRKSLEAVDTLTSQIGENTYKEDTVEKIYQQFLDTVNHDYNDAPTEQETYIAGKKEEGRDEVHERIFNNHPSSVIPLGIPEFDAMNGGGFPGSLMLLAASSGGGKSLVAGHTAKYAARQGYHAKIVPLEMTLDEMEMRNAGSEIGLNVRRILTKDLSDDMKMVAINALDTFNYEVTLSGGQYELHVPSSAVSNAKLRADMARNPPDLFILDYPALCSDMRGAGWGELGDSAADWKIWAKENNVFVMLLAQAKDSTTLKYATVMADHCNNLVIWDVNSELRVKPPVVFPHQPKARMQDPSPFGIAFDWQSMTVVDSYLKEWLEYANGLTIERRHNKHIDDYVTYERALLTKLQHERHCRKAGVRPFGNLTSLDILNLQFDILDELVTRYKYDWQKLEIITRKSTIGKYLTAWREFDNEVDQVLSLRGNGNVVRAALANIFGKPPHLDHLTSSFEADEDDAWQGFRGIHRPPHYVFEPPEKHVKAALKGKNTYKDDYLTNSEEYRKALSGGKRHPILSDPIMSKNWDKWDDVALMSEDDAVSDDEEITRDKRGEKRKTQKDPKRKKLVKGGAKLGKIKSTKKNIKSR